MDKRHRSTSLLRIPTICPVCGAESLHQIDIAQAAGALLDGGAVILSAQCHRSGWSASPAERAQIREYLRVLLPAPGAVAHFPTPADAAPP